MLRAKKSEDRMSEPEIHDASTELSSNRTTMSFQRTRMSADRTLMSIIRTALSLIGFGFTIFQFFRFLRESVPGSTIVTGTAPRDFGLALVALGVAMLAFGILAEFRFMRNLRAMRRRLIDRQLLVEDPFPVSLVLITAFLLLLIGIFAIISMVARSGQYV